jgi:glutathione synthase/RimK-type ligase-like ATP-grasp enzyme
MSAYQTWSTSAPRAASDEIAVREVLKRSGAMIQRFVPEVRTSDEWSFMFFGKQYSHAVLKRPKPWDFRVQRDLGGYLDNALPASALVAQARKIIELIREPLLYARVDGIEVDGELVMMELELIDPELFLAADQLAPRRFADATIATFHLELGTGSYKSAK